MLDLVQAILTVAYPLLVWLALGRLSPRAVGLVLVGLVAIRLLFARLGAGPLRRDALRGSAELLAPIVLVGLVAAGTAIWNDPLGLLAAPVLVNAALFVSFAGSLRRTTLVERLARLQVGVLSRAEVDYCRRVTLVWSGFFVVNGAVAGALALRRDPAAWAFYTGFLSYVLMGTLFAAEYVHRHARFRRYVGSFTDPLLSRLFPPRFAPTRLDEGAGEAAAWRVALEVPTGLACWPGHFPGEPIVPGVVLVDWALATIAHRQGRAFRPDAIEGLKFKQPVRPADRLLLELEAEPDGGGGGEAGGRVDAGAGSRAELLGERIAFTFRRAGEVVAEGRLHRASSQGPGDAPPAGRGPTAGETGPTLVDARERTAAKTAAATTPVWPDPAAVLVHAPPMVWLASIEAHDANGTLGRASVDDLGVFREADGGVGAHVALEWMAQCVAAHAGLDRRARGEAPCLGLLLGAKRVRFARAAYTAGESFRVVAAPSWVGDGGAAAFDCRVESLDSGEVVADARLSCFMPRDGFGENGLPMSSIDVASAKTPERGR